MKISNLSICIREIIHPFVLKQMEKKYIKKYKPIIIGNSIDEIINMVEGKPILFLANHSNSYDIPIALNAIKEHCYVMYAKQPTEIIDKIGLWLNGVNLVDRKDKNSKKEAKEREIELLKNNKHNLKFPEATWNREKKGNKLMLEMAWSFVEESRNTGCAIVTFIMDYKEDECRIKFNKPFIVSAEMTNQEGYDKVMEDMCTARIELWERDPIIERKNVNIEELASYIDEWPKEYPKLDLEYEESVIRKNEHLTVDEVWELNSMTVEKEKNADNSSIDGENRKK